MRVERKVVGAVTSVVSAVLCFVVGSIVVVAVVVLVVVVVSVGLSVVVVVVGGMTVLAELSPDVVAGPLVV